MTAEHVYPAGPGSVPADLTRPTRAYRTHAWLAMGGLALFVLLYLALASWFSWTAYRLFASLAHGADPLWTFVAGICSAFLAVFMWKALVFVKHRHAIDDIEVTASEQPRLFAFINRLADEAGAPRAHRVFLSPRVNAAVFYDLSVLNLLFPSRKNLEIGLGLVNAVSLGELKAVLAHEFGHFGQRSMAVGRWVYIAQQIAGHIIAKRDALDSFLRGLSRVDLRIAWVGWLLSLIVWSIRSLMETVFRVVVLAQRALSREMELQADLVAVSLTGSQPAPDDQQMTCSRDGPSRIDPASRLVPAAADPRVTARQRCGEQQHPPLRPGQRSRVHGQCISVQPVPTRPRAGPDPGTTGPDEPAIRATDQQLNRGLIGQ